MQEGPSPTDPTAKSTMGGITVVESTFKSFRTAAAATGHSAKDYKTYDVPYPITEWYDLDNPVLMRTIVSDVVDGSTALNKAVKHYLDLCSTSKLELVGYSEGAWVIEYWLHFHQSEADKYVKAIQLYGDPNYYEVYGRDRHGVHAYQGLSRLAVLTFGWYGPPYPNPNTHYRVKTVCITKDPVCGKGYTDSLIDHTSQFYTAGKCLFFDCPHLDGHYVNKGYTIRGAEFLAKYAF
jgi:cutinase